MFSSIKTSWCITNLPTTIYTLLLNFWISWFFCPTPPLPLDFYHAPHRWKMLHPAYPCQIPTKASGWTDHNQNIMSNQDPQNPTLKHVGGRRGATPLSYLIYKDRKITQNHWKSLNNFINRGLGGSLGIMGVRGVMGSWRSLEEAQGSLLTRRSWWILKFLRFTGDQ